MARTARKKRPIALVSGKARSGAHNVIAGKCLAVRSQKTRIVGALLAFGEDQYDLEFLSRSSKALPDRSCYVSRGRDEFGLCGRSHDRTDNRRLRHQQSGEESGADELRR